MGTCPPPSSHVKPFPFKAHRSGRCCFLQVRPTGDPWGEAGATSPGRAGRQQAWPGLGKVAWRERKQATEAGHLHALAPPTAHACKTVPKEGEVCSSWGSRMGLSGLEGHRGLQHVFPLSWGSRETEALVLPRLVVPFSPVSEMPWNPPLDTRLHICCPDFGSSLVTDFLPPPPSVSPLQPSFPTVVKDCFSNPNLTLSLPVPNPSLASHHPGDEAQPPYLCLQSSPLALHEPWARGGE